LHSTLNITADSGPYSDKLPVAFAEECDLLQEFEQIVAWFENNNEQKEAGAKDQLSLE